MAPQPSTLWPVLHYDDTEAALGFFAALGFDSELVVRDGAGSIVHAEMGWPGGGRFLFGSTSHRGGVHDGLGASAVYVVAEDVDAVHRKAIDAGADVIAAPHETEFGSGERTRALSLRDPEGGVWTFASYRGAATT